MGSVYVLHTALNFRMNVVFPLDTGPMTYTVFYTGVLCELFRC